MMAWLSLLAAGSCEILGFMAMNRINRKKTLGAYVLLGVIFCFSFSFLSYAMKSISMGTAYAVWTGIGTAGGAIVGMLRYGESREWLRFLFIGMIICGAVGLKLFSV